MYENFNLNDQAEAQRIKNIKEFLQLMGKDTEQIEMMVLLWIRQIFIGYRQYIISGGQRNIAPGIIQRIKVMVLFLNDKDLEYIVSKFLECPYLENLQNVIYKLDDAINKKTFDLINKAICV